MSVIFFLMGKSATGKDGLGHMLLEDRELFLEPVIMYTTRPMRAGEENGREYYFVNRADLERFRSEGRIIEERVYHTVQGDWYYFTCADDAFIADMKNTEKKYLVIGTLEAYTSYKDYFGGENVIPLYIEVRDDLRLIRSVEREKDNASPDYKEVCRRYLADEEDFSPANLSAAGITKVFSNNGKPDECYREIREYIKRKKDDV